MIPMTNHAFRSRCPFVNIIVKLADKKHRRDARRFSILSFLFSHPVLGANIQCFLSVDARGAYRRDKEGGGFSKSIKYMVSLLNNLLIRYKLSFFFNISFVV